MIDDADLRLIHPRVPLRASRLRHLGWTGVRHAGSLVRMMATERGKGFPELGALQLRLAFQGLGPAFVKMGQFISSSPGAFPQPLVDEFAHCLDAVPPESWETALTTIEEEIGPVTANFAHLDPRPLAAGSIAQVHAGVLKTGEEVVIKIQRRGLEDLLRQDLRMMLLGGRLLLRVRPSFAVANPIGIIEDFATTLSQEMTFRREAANMDQLRQSFIGWPVVIPLVHHELTTDRVIVMERIHGTKVSDVDELRSLGLDLAALGDLILAAFFSSALRDGVFHGDGHAGNLFGLPDGRLGMLDFGIVGYLSEPERGAISRFLVALFEQRFDAVVEGIIELTDAPMSDVAAVVAELGELAGRYLSGPLSEMNMSALFGELLGSANRHGLSLPANHVLLFKQLLYLDGLSRALNPELDVFRDGMRYRPYFAPEAGGCPVDAPNIPDAAEPRHASSQDARET